MVSWMRETYISPEELDTFVERAVDGIIETIKCI